MHPLALKSGERPLGTSVHTKMYNTFFMILMKVK